MSLDKTNSKFFVRFNHDFLCHKDMLLVDT